MGEGEMPEEIELLSAIKRYGAVNVLGRPMSALEIKRIGNAENMLNVCGARSAAMNWTTWETDNPNAAAFLKFGEQLAAEMGLIERLDA